jgi:hypothetical protein
LQYYNPDIFISFLKISGLHSETTKITIASEDYRSITINCFFGKQKKFRLRQVEDKIFIVLLEYAEFPPSNQLLAELKLLIRKSKQKDKGNYYKNLLLLYIYLFKNKKQFKLTADIINKMIIDLPHLLSTLNSYKMYSYAKSLIDLNSKAIFYE